MTVKLPELWLQYAGDDLRSAKVLLNDVYIDSRYPADFGVLPSGEPDEQEANVEFTCDSGAYSSGVAPISPWSKNINN